MLKLAITSLCILGMTWEYMSSELLSLIGDRGDGIPQIHNRLSAELMQTYITDALDAHGITVHRERTSERRTLRLSRGRGRCI